MTGESKFLRERDISTNLTMCASYLYEGSRKNKPLTCISFLLLSGVEKKNDDFRRFFHRKINRWDACTSLLLVEKRQEALKCCQRQSRSYVKRDTNFWCDGGKQESAKKVPRISAVEKPREDVLTTPNATEDPQKKTITQSVDELKKLKIGDLIQLLNELIGHKPSLPKKPRKPDLISKITEIANLRSN